MKEIKFRVWDKDRKKFAKQITSLKFDRDGNINLVVYLDRVNKLREILDNEKIYCNNFEIMQYTGLKDKNGKEIYEGDIVKIFFDSEKYEAFLVEYDNLCWQLREIGQLLWDYCNLYECEVVGNIYENPELLKEEK